MTRPQSSLWPAARDAVALTSSWLPTSLCALVRAGRGQPGPVPAREVGVPSEPDAGAAWHPTVLANWQPPVSHRGRKGDWPDRPKSAAPRRDAGGQGAVLTAVRLSATREPRPSPVCVIAHGAFFLTPRNCRAGPLVYHMASSTCCRLAR